MSLTDPNDYFKSGQSMGIANVHLISGEDIIGEVVVLNDNIQVKNPVMPNAQFDPSNGQMRFGLMPFRPWIADEPLVMRGDKVVWMAPLRKDTEDAYRQIFSRVQLATANQVPSAGKLSDILSKK